MIIHDPNQGCFDISYPKYGIIYQTRPYCWYGLRYSKVLQLLELSKMSSTSTMVYVLTMLSIAVLPTQIWVKIHLFFNNDLISILMYLMPERTYPFLIIVMIAI